ncbi:MAG: flavodoxin-dependent (E)-4-hydroxy-3-methylbut-2-enyl-diphosphate synthase [Lentisphaeria bacterium]
MLSKTRLIRLGSKFVGGLSPVTVQTMTNTPTCDVENTLSQIKACQDCGCDIIRLAIPDLHAANALSSIIPHSQIPIVADIQYDYRLAIAAAENGAHCLRINPGNIARTQNSKRVKMIVDCAKKHQIPIRIGVNSGSLDKNILKKFGSPSSHALVESAIQQCSILEQFNFFDIKVSIKSSNTKNTVEAAKLFHHFIKKRAKLGTGDFYPQHIGITESGTYADGIIKSAVGIGALLMQNIGNTIRVSLTAPPQDEVKAAIKILEACSLRTPLFELISCPTCARCSIDLQTLAESVHHLLSCSHIKKPLKIAVMGCMVNGPGEASQADIGLAASQNSVSFFRHNKIISTVPAEYSLPTLINILSDLNFLNK